ncbi:MAG: hypothetical protein ABSA97_13300 [Verrucomicrobiia bacterium]|jgi:hypothetical protein
MIRDPNMVREFERHYAANLDSYLPYEQAKRIYEDLWLRAVNCGAIDLSSPLEGVDADIEVARTLNALPTVRHV